MSWEGERKCDICNCIGEELRWRVEANVKTCSTCVNVFYILKFCKYRESGYSLIAMPQYKDEIVILKGIYTALEEETLWAWGSGKA